MIQLSYANTKHPENTKAYLTIHSILNYFLFTIEYNNNNNDKVLLKITLMPNGSHLKTSIYLNMENASCMSLCFMLM